MIVSIRIKLSVMMFLQFFIWGAWYVTAANYLSTVGFGGNDIGWTYAMGPVAGMLTPFFVGMVADRFFSAQRVLGILHLLGAVLMYYATTLMTSGQSPDSINLIILGYMLAYYPTLALSNTIAMRHIQDTKKDFPLIRVFGTIGWIVVGLLLTQLGWDASVEMFYLCVGASIALGFLSFFLPDTPPESKGESVTFGQVLGVDAFALLKDRSYLVFLISSILICIPLAFYYQLASRVVELANLPIAQTMSYGQMSEIVFMLVMPLFFARLGVKWMLFVGMGSWVLRYALFALGAPAGVSWMILSGVIIHGICYDFFFVTGQIYTDKVAPKNIRAQAQGLLVFFTLGLGMFIGAKVGGQVESMYTSEESTQYAAQVQAVSDRIAELVESGVAGEALERLTAEKNEFRAKQLETMDWGMIWGIPAIMAGVIMVFFTLVFREPETDGESD